MCDNRDIDYAMVYDKIFWMVGLIIYVTVYVQFISCKCDSDV